MQYIDLYCTVQYKVLRYDAFRWFTPVPCGGQKLSRCAAQLISLCVRALKSAQDFTEMALVNRLCPHDTIFLEFFSKSEFNWVMFVMQHPIFLQYFSKSEFNWVMSVIFFNI
jgi:hypothetical protein